MPSSKRRVGDYEFTTFAVPEGDHWRWQVNRADMGLDTLDHVGRKVAQGATGRAATEEGRIQGGRGLA